MKKIALDIWWTKIIWALFSESNDILKTIKENIWKYILKDVLDKIQNIIDKLSKNEKINYIWISLNWQSNNWFIYFSRVLGWEINDYLEKYLKLNNNIILKIENDVNCMCLWINYLSKEKLNYIVLLNIWTWLRSSYFYDSKLLKWSKWFFWEIRDNIDILELQKTININDLICWRWVSNIYKIISWKDLSSEEIYNLSKNWEENALKTIEIFKKYFINLLCRISYTFNPEIIYIDWSLKTIIEENYEKIIKNYKNECEKHFISEIKIVNYDNSALFWALFIN